MLAVEHMSALPAYFKDIPDPRRTQGRRHPLPSESIIRDLLIRVDPDGLDRAVLHKKTGELTSELALGITSQSPEQAAPQSVLTTNRGHWVVENSCHYIIDWNFHDDRSRFSDGKTTTAEKMRRLNRNTPWSSTTCV